MTHPISKIRWLSTFVGFILCCLFLPTFVLAQSPLSPFTPPPPGAHIDTQTEAFLGQRGVGTGTTTYDVRSVVANIVRGATGLLGIIFIIYAVYGGMMILTSAGDEDKVAVGKSSIRTATLGVLISFGAYAITTFVTSAILRSSAATNERESFIEFSRDPDINLDLDPNAP